ncbi:hypothetical protein [Photobacterium phosphoreum]|uniref:hypothetical protein n=1 Tax=Photobacterium phosphoreum TaxID=659 RepID=UPI0039AF9A65
MKEKGSKIDIDNFRDVAIGSATYELTQRFGRAGGEFLIGLHGIDHETGQKFDRSLLQVSQGKINPDFSEQNIKQQAGFSAEIRSVNKRNAEAIINRTNSKTFRSEDFPGYGKNHNVVDLIEVVDSDVITSQTKFVTNQDELLKKIACGDGGKNDMSRYLEVDKLEVPTEQVESMKLKCQEQAKILTVQSENLKAEGNLDLAQKKIKQAQNYQKLEQKISDSGLTTEEAIYARLYPRWETAKEITQISHRAGLEGAKFGVVIGGAISAVTNIIAVTSGDKEFSDALLDTGKGTLISGVMGYTTGASGTAIKTYMSQSTSIVTRNLAKTNLPAQIISMTLATGKSIRQYAMGEITESELFEEIGCCATGAISTSMFTVIGQMAIPIPVFGGVIGGMVGYALTNTFYQSFFEVLRSRDISSERRKLIEMQCAAAKLIAQEYEQKIKFLFSARIKELEGLSLSVFRVLDDPIISSDEFCFEINRFADNLGTKLSINSMSDLEKVMLSDEPLVI